MSLHPTQCNLQSALYRRRNAWTLLTAPKGRTVPWKISRTLMWIINTYKGKTAAILDPIWRYVLFVQRFRWTVLPSKPHGTTK